MRGRLFRTTARAFRLGAAAVPRCSITVHVEATGGSMEHDQTCTKLATLCEGDLQDVVEMREKRMASNEEAAPDERAGASHDDA